MAQTTLSGTTGKKDRTTAEMLAEKQQSISISEFFTKNRHLLGFDNPRKALLTTVKEAVDNSLDACQEMKVLPEIRVILDETAPDRYKITVEDNGPGIVKQQIPNIFAKLLYGSKFHRLRQSLTADEPIFIQRNGKIEIVPIGTFVDSYLTENEDTKDISKMKVFAPAFDSETNKYTMQKVSNVIRHNRENEILKIKTQYNKEIKVTGCHSLFAFNDKTGKVESVEARDLSVGSYIVVPKKLPDISNITEINVLDYISLATVKKNYFYVYNIPESVLTWLITHSQVIHKKTDKSRKYYRIQGIDILDDSLKQYTRKKFLPLTIVLQLHLEKQAESGIIKTYHHGKETVLPVTIPITKEFLRFLGFFVAEGHSDTRQIGLTFGKHEEHYVQEMVHFVQIMGLNCSIERRENHSIRLKVFGNIFVIFIRTICGKLAAGKRIPSFIFLTNEEMRWHFIDAYCQGDGHKVKKRNSLMFSTKSKQLALSLQYLFLQNGITSSYGSNMDKGLGKVATLTHKVAIYGDSLNGSHIYNRDEKRMKKRDLEYNYTKATGVLLQEVAFGDLAFVRIKDIQVITEGYNYVYDLSVPGSENFVGGIGAIACHNSRGQQGIGISAAALYGQLTTGKPIRIISKIGPKAKAHYYELHLNTKTNEPEITIDEEREWEGKDHGTKVQIELEGKYQQGKLSVDEFLQLTAISNPEATIIYKAPGADVVEFARASKDLPREAREIQPHPYGVELGTLMRMLRDTKAPSLQSFLQQDFCRVSASVAKEICEKASLEERAKPSTITRDEVEKIFHAIKQVKIMAPPTDCLSPIGEEQMLKGLKKEINAEFYAAVTRPPVVYRGFPFQLEVALAYGGDLPKDEFARVIRYANRVPLQHQPGACALTRSIIQTAWKNYGLSQSKGTIPTGPLVVMVHMASVWVPFTSESKEAVASYPEIIKEIRLALQDAGRKLASYIRKTVKAREQQERVGLFEKYIPELAGALATLTGEKKSELEEELQKILKKGLKDLLAEAKEAEKEEISNEGVAYGEKQKGLA